MRVLVVDKEPNDLNALTAALATRRDIDVFDSAENISEALTKLPNDGYDVVFLNSPIQEMCEFELVDLLKKLSIRMPSVVVVTTCPNAASAGVDNATARCVMQSFLNESIHDALIPNAVAESHAPQTAALPQLIIPSARPPKIAIAMEGKALLIDPADIIAVEAEGNYVLLVRLAGSHLVRGRISLLAEELLPYGFLQIHRCILVNTSWVDRIHPRSTGDYVLCTRGGKEYPVSRTYKQNLRSLAPLWIGSDVLFAD